MTNSILRFSFILFVGLLLFSCNSKSENKKAEVKSKQTETAPNTIQAGEADKIELEQQLQDSIEQSKIKGFSVKQISGKHRYGGITKIEYKCLAQVLFDVEQRADKQMWTKEDKISAIQACKVAGKGGQIRLDINRSTIEAANTDMFSIIIKDIDEKEIWRTELPSKTPETPSSNPLGDFWWNIKFKGIDKRIKAPFYVYVVDRLEEAPFKFEVSPIMRK
jgi:hypothetical protein